MLTLDDPPHIKIYLYLCSFLLSLFKSFQIFPRCYIPIFDINSTYIFSQNRLEQISNTNIYFEIYIFPNSAPEGRTETTQLTFIPPTVCMMYPTRIYIKLTYIPQIVGSIYSIKIYISTKLYSPTLQLQLVLAWYIKYQNIYSTDIFSPNCWLHISNKKFSLLKKLKAYKKAFCGQETEPSNICM